MKAGESRLYEDLIHDVQSKCTILNSAAVLLQDGIEFQKQQRILKAIAFSANDLAKRIAAFQQNGY